MVAAAARSREILPGQAAWMSNVRRQRERPVAWGRRRQDEAEAPEPGRNPRIRRWIGAARRRALRLRREETHATAQVITLTWAQTFGRPSAPRDEAAAFAPQSQTIVLLRRV